MPALDGWGDLTPYLSYVKNRARSLRLDPRLNARFGESDLVSETFLRAQASDVSCAGTSLRERLAYLDQALNRVFIDHLREHHAERRDIDKEQAAQEALNESTAEYRLEVLDRGASPSEQAVRREGFLRAMVALDQLPERERDVLTLTYLRGLTVPEAAEQLGIHRGHAARLYASGTARLRALLNPGSGG